MKLTFLGCTANAIATRMSRALSVVLLIMTLLVIGCASRVTAQEKKVTVPTSQLPAVFNKAIVGAFPDAKILRVEREVAGEDPGQHDVILLFEETEP